MTIFYILAAIGILFFIGYRKKNQEIRRKEETEGRVLKTEVFSKTDLGHGMSVTAKSTLRDVSPIKEANVRNLIKTFKKPYSLEQEIIMDNPMGFIYFVSSYHSRIKGMKYNKKNDRPRNYSLEIFYLPSKDEDPDKKFTEKKFWDWAVKFNLAAKGNDVPIDEILKSLKLRAGLNQLSDKKFTRIKAALEYLLQLPDIEQRLDEFSARENYYKLKDVGLDTDYLDQQWETIQKT